jgi:hypothetical protein
MPDTEVYIVTPEGHPDYHYTLDPSGLTCRPPGRQPMTVRWEDIRYLEDVAGHRVDVVRRDLPTPIPLYYAPRQFAPLLTAVCSRLAALHRRKIGVQTFSGRRSYFVHIGLVLVVCVLLMLAGSVYLNRYPAAGLFVLVMTLPMTAYLLLQPHTVTPDDDHLVVRDFIRTRVIAYDGIRDLAFGLHGDGQTAFLCLRVHLKDGRRIKIQRFENLTLLYIFIKTKWEAARAPTLGTRTT